MFKEIGVHKMDKGGWGRFTAAIGLVACLGAASLLAAQNGQNGQYQNDPGQQDQQQQMTNQQQGVSGGGMYGGEQQGGPQGPFNQGSPNQGPPPNQGQPYPMQPYSNQPAPRTLTIPPGTVMIVRTTQWLSSDHNHVGDVVNAVLDQPIVVDGWVVARAGQTVLGRVTEVEKGGHGKNVSKLGVELSQLILVDGQQLPLRTELVQNVGRSSTGQDVAAVGITSGMGAAIGAAAAGGKGAGIGAGAGAAAGIIGVLLTPGKPTVVPAETRLAFRTEAPLTFSTERSQQAFQSVNPGDYSSQSYDYYGGRQRYNAPAEGAYPAPSYGNYYTGGYYPYYGPYWGGYYPGYYGYYGFGPRIVIGGRFGGHFRR